MSLPRFRIAAPVETGALVELAGRELHHAQVRRLAIGESVALFDGAGFSCVGAVAHATRDGLTVRVHTVQPPRSGESRLALTLAVGLLKADKLDWVIEKAVELGVAAVQPFSSAHTVAAPSDARQRRWQQLAQAAAKQCGRSVVPPVAAPVDFRTLLAVPIAPRLLLAERDAAAPLAAVGLTPAPAALLAIVGPEGGFSDAELDAARATGCALVGLGPRILRAETAAITTAALCQARWGDLKASDGR
ncbi:MAG: 16S rRNA (uracil(1498)-N(3))-methyltransferase [Deltaproteobacteria bacterium]|nr:16S rRNA (uracil(1498)-N(3))-methyltransferase [Deltaproteobacteria bacterium]